MRTSCDRWFCREQKVHLSRAWHVSPSRTSTSGRVGHTVTSMEKHLAVKITLRRINLQGNVVKRSMTTSTTDSSATRPSGRRRLKWDTLRRSSKRWISIQVKTTLKTSPEQKLTSTVATGGFTQTWQTSIRCQQSINLISRRRCRQCTASSKRRTRINMQNGHKVPPLLLGNGKQTGGSPIMSAHLKDGVTTIERRNLCIKNFYRAYIEYNWRQSTVTDGRCKYNTSCTWNSRTFNDAQKLRNIVNNFKHTLHQHWNHCDQVHERHDAHRRVHCVVLGTLRTVFRCVDLMRSYVTLAQGPRSVFPSHPWSWSCALVLECCLLPVLPPPAQVPLPPLPDSCHGAWWRLHEHSPVQLRCQEHGQPELCHSRHRLWTQGHGTHRHQWAQQTCGNPSQPNSKTKQKKETTIERVNLCEKETTIERSDPLDSEIPEWLQEFRENLVDDEIPFQGGSHEFISWSLFGTNGKETWGFWWTQCSCSFP